MQTLLIVGQQTSCSGYEPAPGSGHHSDRSPVSNASAARRLQHYELYLPATCTEPLAHIIGSRLQLRAVKQASGCVPSTAQADALLPT